MNIKKRITKILRDNGLKAPYVSLMKDGKNLGEWYCIYVEANDGQVFCLMNDGSISVNKTNYVKEPEENNKDFIVLDSEVLDDILIVIELKDKLLRMMQENPPEDI